MPMLQHWNDLEPTRAGAAVSRQSLPGTGASLVRVSIAAGTSADRHSHPHEQFVQVVSGSGRLTTQEGSAPFSAGSLFHFPPDAWHAAHFDTDTVLIETNLAP